MQVDKIYLRVPSLHQNGEGDNVLEASTRVAKFAPPFIAEVAVIIRRSVVCLLFVASVVLFEGFDVFRVCVVSFPTS